MNSRQSRASSTAASDAGAAPENASPHCWQKVASSGFSCVHAAQDFIAQNCNIPLPSVQAPTLTFS
jgi:hypothetical protein